MNGSQPNEEGLGVQSYGDSFADVYDDWYGEVTDAEATARFVAERCGPGPVLELGVGTGRLARPLLAHGLDVVGLDASAAMLEGCVDGERGERVLVVQADMAALPFRCRFGAVLIAFNTLFNLPSAEQQRRLFGEIAALLSSDGVVVVEAMNTAALSVGPPRSVALSRHHDDGVTVVATNLDAEAQTILGQHVEVRSSGIRRRPWLLRWSSHLEIDRYASDAGLIKSERHATWDLQPHTEDSDSHITVYRAATDS